MSKPNEKTNREEYDLWDHELFSDKKAAKKYYQESFRQDELIRYEAAKRIVEEFESKEKGDAVQ